MVLTYRDASPRVQTLVRKDADGRSLKATARCTDDRTNSWELEVSIPSGEKWQRQEYGNDVDIGMKLAVMAAKYDGEFRHAKATGDRPRDTMKPDRNISMPEAPITQTPPHLSYRK